MIHNYTAVSIVLLGIVSILACTSDVLAFEGVDLPEVYSRQTTWEDTLLSTCDNFRKLSHTPKGEQANPPAKLDTEAISRDLWRKLSTDFPVRTDWMLQDLSHERARYWFRDIDDRTMVEDLIQAVLREIGANGGNWDERYAALRKRPFSSNRWMWLDFYVKACEERRARRLVPLLKKYRKFVFAKQYNSATSGTNHFAYTENLSDIQWNGYFTFRPGGSLCLLEMEGLYGTVRPLLEDDKGSVRDPDTSFDGKRVLFSWKKSAREDDYHLYEMDIASGSTRQITKGIGFADYEGIYLPNDDILFSSTRCVQTVDCDWAEVSNLYLCDKDGRFLRRVGFDQVHTLFPSLLDDGRVIFTRWEYNDRGQIYPQPLFQMNPDGSGQTEFYGNNSWFPTAIIHARVIPGTNKVLAVLTGHHTSQRGKLAVIDRNRGQQENAGVQLVAPLRETPAVRQDVWGQEGDQFKYPYPIDETNFLISYTPYHADNKMFPHAYGLYLMTIDGRRELLAYDATISCLHAVPLAPRRKPVERPSLVDYTRTTGTCFLADIYAGPGLRDIPRGTVKSLRVVALDYRPASIGGHNNSGGAGFGAATTPISVAGGSYDVKRVLGTATVHEDGSACFEVPARVPVYFQALDGNGHMVQSMRSWMTLQPGERVGCVGCHETKNTTPIDAGQGTLALRNAPEKLIPGDGPLRGFSYPREVQPILDRHCIGCHNNHPQSESKIDLTSRVMRIGSARRKWSASYITLTNASEVPSGGYITDKFLDKDDPHKCLREFRAAPNELVNWIDAQTGPPMLHPYAVGAARSRLISLLKEGHYDVQLSRSELDTIARWIDLAVPYCGDYTEANAWCEPDSQKYQRYLKKRLKMERIEKHNIDELIKSKAIR